MLEKVWKYSGIFLIVTGIIHSIVGIVIGKDYLIDIIKDGLLNAVEVDNLRHIAFWFLLCGIFIIILGHTLHYYIKKEQKPPLFLGYYLLVMAVISCILMPASGFWLFIPQAFIILFAKRK